MHRIDTSDREVDKHGSGKDGFTEGDPTVPTPATTVSADIADAWQEELCNTVEASGTLDKADNTQLLGAIRREMNRYQAGAWMDLLEDGANPNFNGIDGHLAKVIVMGQPIGGQPRIFRSDDHGQNFNIVTLGAPKNFAINDVAIQKVGNGSFIVGVGQADGGDAYILRSTNGGIGFGEIANPKNFELNSVAHDGGDPGVFVAVGDADGSDAYIVSSADEGASWAERSNAQNVDLNAVTYSPRLGLFIAVGNATGSGTYIVTSPDGVNWTQRTSPINVTMRAVVDAPEAGVVVVAGVGDVLTSPDGITWTHSASPGGSWFAANNLGGVILIGGTGPSGLTEIQGSFDGVNWSADGVNALANNSSENDEILGIGVGDNRFYLAYTNGYITRSNQLRLEGI